MIKSETRLREWGNSIGVILPKDEIYRENLSVNDEVEVIVKKKTNPLREVFGTLRGVKPKTKMSTDEILAEVDKEFGSKFD